MKMNKFYQILVAAALLLPLNAGAKELFKAEEFSLENGLRVVVIENYKAPLIKHMIWYNAGAVDEKYGKGGSAHLLEHLMFRGTKKVKDGEFNSVMHENGVDSNAFTSYDMTVYHEFADVSRLEALMALEADRMQNLNFDEKAFAAEQKIVFQERKQVVENNPSAPFGERLNILLWGNSQYGHPVTGLADEIMSLTAEDVRDFYQSYYAPNNAVLVLAGDINVPTAKKLAEKYYGKIPAREIIKQKIAAENVKFNERLKMKLPQITTPKLVYKYLLPDTEMLNDKIYDYMVLAEYLGGGQTSALYNALVEKLKVAVGVSADYSFNASANSVFSLSAIPAPQTTMLALKIAFARSKSRSFAKFDCRKVRKS